MNLNVIGVVVGIVGLFIAIVQTWISLRQYLESKKLPAVNEEKELRILRALVTEIKGRALDTYKSSSYYRRLKPLLPPQKPHTDKPSHEHRRIIKGKPITFLLSPGQRNESLFLEQLMEQVAVKRSGRGRPRIRPLRLVGDKGYTGRRIRNYLRRRGIRLTIPRLSTEPRRGSFNREIYRKVCHGEYPRGELYVNVTL